MAFALPRLPMILLCQSPMASVLFIPQRITARAPWISKVLKSRLPLFDKEPRELFPSELCCLGTNPHQAENYRPFLNWFPAPTSLSSATVKKGPKPGILLTASYRGYCCPSIVILQVSSSILSPISIRSLYNVCSPPSLHETVHSLRL